MRYDNVVWDWNGTLLDDVALALGIVNGILVDHQLAKLTVARYRQIFDFPVQQYYERAGMDFGAISFDAVSERYCHQFEAGIANAQLFDPVPSVLAELRTAGVRQFVLSSTEHEALQPMVARFAIAPIFDAIQGMPDGLARGKVSIGETLVQAHQLSSTRTLMVGDTLHDWEVAQQLGLDAVLVTTGHHAPERLAAAGCPVVDSVADIVTMVTA